MIYCVAKYKPETWPLLLVKNIDPEKPEDTYGFRYDTSKGLYFLRKPKFRIYQFGNVQELALFIPPITGHLFYGGDTRDNRDMVSLSLGFVSHYAAEMHLEDPASILPATDIKKLGTLFWDVSKFSSKYPI